MYQALYRKWRPRTFDDVVGQSHITETLKNQVASGRLSHAYLFIGTRGTGKTTCAKILAKAVNCESPVNGNPCNVCPICRGIDDGSIMDVVEMDAASNNGVDSVRALRDEAIFSPATARRRVYIIDEVHMLSTSAFNALLKILEEPPAHLMFILATTELNKVPATILSRCQRHSFKRLDTASIRERLEFVASKENIDLSSDAAQLIAGLSEGGMRDALSILDQCSGRERIDIETVYSAMGLAGNQQMSRLVGCIAAGDTTGALTLFQQLWQGGKDPATLLGQLSSLHRDMLMCAVAPKAGRDMLSGSFDDSILNSLSGLMGNMTLINNISVLQDALGDMKLGQARIKAELCLIRLCSPQLSGGSAALLGRIEKLEAAVKNGLPTRTAEPAAPHAEAEVRAPEPPFDPSDAKAPAMKAEVPSADTPSAPAAEAVPETPSADETPASDSDWASLCSGLEGKLPRGIYIVLSDPAQVSGQIDGDVVSLTLKNDFARMQIDRSDQLAAIAAQAQQFLGRPVTVQVASGGSADASGQDKLDALGRFGFVQFK